MVMVCWFRTARGKNTFTEGHQRGNLARASMPRTAQNPRLNAWTCAESDGVTERRGAGDGGGENIAEGTGTAVDDATCW